MVSDTHLNYLLKIILSFLYKILKYQVLTKFTVEKWWFYSKRGNWGIFAMDCIYYSKVERQWIGRQEKKNHLFIFTIYINLNQKKRFWAMAITEIIWYGFLKFIDKNHSTQKSILCGVWSWRKNMLVLFIWKWAS